MTPPRFVGNFNLASCNVLTNNLSTLTHIPRFGINAKTRQKLCLYRLNTPCSICLVNLCIGVAKHLEISLSNLILRSNLTRWQLTRRNIAPNHF